MLIIFKKTGLEFFKLIPLGTFKIFTSYLMVMSTVKSVYKVQIPDNLVRFFNSLAFLSFDVSSGANCVALVKFSFYARFISICFSWVIVIVLAMLVYYARVFFLPRGRPRVEWKALIIKWMVFFYLFVLASSSEDKQLFALTTLHPTVSNTMFQVLNCEEVYGYNSWLREDFTLQCLTPTWWVFTILGAVMAVSFTLGLPFALLALLKYRFQPPPPTLPILF